MKEKSIITKNERAIREAILEKIIEKIQEVIPDIKGADLEAQIN